MLGVSLKMSNIFVTHPGQKFVDSIGAGALTTSEKAELSSEVTTLLSQINTDIISVIHRIFTTFSTLLEH